ncbi:glycosyltransferase [Lelliottia sp. SL45]|jgi:glycosyltransferase involved in cell wall biosynthesis|uniref:glycosyltransferase family 2 protein n=1 Tax=Lelliottia TaxID=1330545 RepID=UPI000FB0C784|nr:glycosyltransferase [Lelliottia sp. SL45]MCY1698437.1 glycosyltransferase [Lelliottia sp. SL45]
MNLPKVSVLIPCYNHEKYIAKCLDGVRASYSGEIEVIICDDKSKDHSVKIIDNYINIHNNSHISFIFIKNHVNLGVTKTLNICAGYATSEYIYVIASDDYLLEGGLTQAMKLLLKACADAVISDCIVVDGDNAVICQSAFFGYRNASIKRLKKNIAEELVFNWVVPGPALLQKKSTYVELSGYNETLRAEDRDYFLRLLADKKVIFNKRCIAGYRVHLHNASRSGDYLKVANAEFNKVNYSASVLYNGLARIYLKTYWLDLKKYPVFITSKIRKIIKMLYILRGLYG